MITTATRRCPACRELVDGEQECPRCNRAQTPPLAEWPAGAKRFLLLLLLTDTLAMRIRATEQQQMEFLLENTMRGRYYQGRLVPYAASAADCYPEFTRLLARWQAQGSPTDVAAIAALRGLH